MLSEWFYLQAYCLKVKEMDDEEYSYAALQEPLYRVETGNYEYRYKNVKCDKYFLSIHLIRIEKAKPVPVDTVIWL